MFSNFQGKLKHYINLFSYMFLNLTVIEDSHKTSVSLDHYFQGFCDISKWGYYNNERD